MDVFPPTLSLPCIFFPLLVPLDQGTLVRYMVEGLDHIVCRRVTIPAYDICNANASFDRMAEAVNAISSWFVCTLVSSGLPAVSMNSVFFSENWRVTVSAFYILRQWHQFSWVH